jgi:hypothetical protein
MFKNSRERKMRKNYYAVIGTMAMSIESELRSGDIALTAGIKPGHIYPVLARLERSGIVTSRWGDYSGKKRRLYKLNVEFPGRWPDND